MPVTSVLALSTLILYTLASLSAFAALFRRDRKGTLLTPALATAGLIAHMAEIVLVGFQEGRCPVLNRYEVMSLLSWLVVLVYVLTYARTRLQALSVILAPLALVILVTSNILQFVLPPQTVSLGVAQQGSLFVVHVLISIVGIAALFLTFASSLLYLVQDHLLKSKQHAVWLRFLPPLDRCDRMVYQSLMAGFPLLTLGILSGSILSASRSGQFWSWRVDEAFSVIAWSIFAALIWARLMKGWRGRKSAYLTMAGFAAGLMTMVGMFI